MGANGILLLNATFKYARRISRSDPVNAAYDKKELKRRLLKYCSENDLRKKNPTMDEESSKAKGTTT